MARLVEPAISGLKALAGAVASQSVDRRAGKGPGPWTVALALAVQAGVFVWTAVAIAVPWPVALVPTAAVAVVVGLEVARGAGRRPQRRGWPEKSGLVVALTLTVVAAMLLMLVLFVVLVQGSLAGKGILPFLVMPLLLVVVDAGLILTLTLALVLIMATAVLMDVGPVEFIAIPLVVSAGVASILFQAISPGPGRGLTRLPGAGGRPGRRGADSSGGWL